MTAEPIADADDPRRLLTDMRALSHRVRLDQRMTWAALLVLAALTFAAIPFDWFGMQVTCVPDGCQFDRRGLVFYWPPALLLGYATITVLYVRAARARGLGARVLPYAITGAVTTIVTPAAYLGVKAYFATHPIPDQPLPYWYMVLDRLIMPWALIGVALLVLTWLERNVALLAFTLGYLTLVLFVLPMNFGFDPYNIGFGPEWGLRAGMALPQLIAGTVLLAGALGFRAAAKKHR